MLSYITLFILLFEIRYNEYMADLILYYILRCIYMNNLVT